MFKASLEHVAFGRGQVIQQFDNVILHAHFPTTAIASLLVVLHEDDPVQNTTVGREGFVGLSVTLDIDVSMHRVICQMAGDCLRIRVRHFRDILERTVALPRLIERYTAYTLHGAGQSIACNALHGVEARACRWLLTIHDQAGRDEFAMTQEFLAFMLGVRRQSVNMVASVLQGAGLIGYRRGIIVIRDRLGLEKAACECYASIKGYYDRVVLENPRNPSRIVG